MKARKSQQWPSSISRRAFLVASGKTRVGLWLFLKSLLVVLACVCVCATLSLKLGNSWKSFATATTTGLVQTTSARLVKS